MWAAGLPEMSLKNASGASKNRPFQSSNPRPAVRFASSSTSRYDDFSMGLALRRLSAALGAALLLAAASSGAAGKPEILPLSEIHAGMKGVAYTIFEGDKIEPMDLEVLGVLPNALGPKQDIILVELKGAKVEHTGVVAGMSGSPVYIDSKLVGAISLKLGIFTKEAIAGITPIENILEVQNAGTPTRTASPGLGGLGSPVAAAGGEIRLPEQITQRYGLSSGSFLKPIESPLVASGFYPQTLARYAGEFAGLGMTAIEGGTVPPRPDDSQIQPGSMVGMVLIRGDLSLDAGCTVTAIVGDDVFVCGHPLLGYGSVAFPMTRGHVVTTLASSLESTKIMTSGGEIGTITQDRLTAVMGRLGSGPPMLPLDLTVATPAAEKQFHFEMIENPKFTPLLVTLATFNGIVANTLYTDGMTIQLSGKIEIEGHSSVELQNMFSPTVLPVPEGFFVASDVHSAFVKIFNNPYEIPHIRKISLRVTSLPERRWATIDTAWSEKSEVAPGETIRIKVLLRPYRGSPFIQEVPITIPPSAGRGNLRILVSDSDTLNRMNGANALGPDAQLHGLEELIQLLNRQHRNDKLYVTLLQPTPTLLVEDKQLPNVPVSELNVLDNRRNLGSSTLLRESVAGEWSVEMNRVIAGTQYLTITVK
jgi:hypothetical protein